ncbi:hypothetical protein [Nostoc sp. PA-18-2419]|uniref:hypothetical protein n=1 Tax=Nostoc sp. PA-18-2419 TaxID=2575443 RepID=UPI001109F220|nr:hypothetical protein [Nostoc sp. PA-18-2419]
MKNAEHKSNDRVSLILLLEEAFEVLHKIEKHPSYQGLLQQGYAPDLNVADAKTSLEYLWTEIVPFDCRQMQAEEPKDRTIELIKLLVWFMKETNRAKKADSN